MSEDSGADVISDLEEGEIPEFEVPPPFIKKHEIFVHSKEEKSVKALNVKNQWEFEKDLSMSNNSLYTRRSPKSSAKNNIIDYRNESLTQFDSPSSEGECTSEEDRNVCGNDTFHKNLFSKELNENRSKYLYPFQTTYGTVEDIMTKIDKTLGRNNNCYYKRRRLKESRYNVDLINNRAKNSSVKESSPVYLNKFRSNYCKMRRYNENNCDSDSKIWEKKDKTKNFNLINGNRKGKDIKNKKKREYDDVILENKNNIDNSKKFKSSKKYEKDFIGCRKKELNLLKSRNSNVVSRPYEDIPLPQETPPAERKNVKCESNSNLITNSVVISSSSKDLSKTTNDPHDVMFNNNNLINDKSDKTSEQFSGDDDDVELIKLRLIALTSNKKKSQSLINDSNDSRFDIKSDLEQEISEFACEYKITDEFDLEGDLASDANSTRHKTSYNTDIDRSELLLRAEALKTALIKKHKHRIKKHKNSSHFTNACNVLVEKNLENSRKSEEIESDIQNLNKNEEIVQQKQDMKTDVLKHVNSIPCSTKDVSNEAALNNALNESSEKNEDLFKLNSLNASELMINKDTVLENDKSVNISHVITKDSISEAISGVNSNINNIGNKTNDNNSKFSGTCSSSGGSSSSDSSSSNSNNYKNNNNSNCNNNNDNTFKENKLLRKQFKKKRWKNNKKVKNLIYKKSNVKENKNQVNDNHEEDDQKLRTQLLNDLLKKKKIIEDEKKSVLIDKLQTSNIQQTEKIKIKKCRTIVKPQNFQKSKGIDILNGENATPKPKMPEMELQRIIVYLGSDSSDEECVLQNNSKTETVLDSNLNKNSENLKDKNTSTKAVENKSADYEKSVELLLKEARKRVEKKSEGVPETPTLEAVFNHLPPSQRLEYMRLKQKIAEREKLKKSKKTINVSKSPSGNNDNSTSKDKKINEEIGLEENNESILSQLSNDETTATTLHSKFASNTENILVEKKIKTENESKSLDNDVKSVSISAKLCKPECVSNELNANIKPKTTSINDKLSNKKAYTQSDSTKSSMTKCSSKSFVRMNTSNNETGMAKTLLERKKVLTLNRLHLEKLKILWKNIRVEKFIEQKYEKEIKRLKTQQNFFELKLNQQKLKIKKLAEESKHIYEVFQKNNNGFDVNDKQKLPVKEKGTINVSKSHVVKRNTNEKNAETKSDDSGRNPPQSTAKAEETLQLKIEGENVESAIHKNIEKGNNKKVSITTASADELKEYNSPLQTFKNGSEFSDSLRIDPNTIMCQFDLLGKCNDEECNYQHWRANSN